MSAFQAVTPAQGSAAASSKERWSGTGTSASSSRSASSVSIPSSDPPSWSAVSIRNGPACQRGKIEAVTRSPTAVPDTPGPSATTSPAPSQAATTSGFTGSG